MWLLYFAVGTFSVFVNVQEILISKFGLNYLSYVDEIVALLAYIIAPFAIRRKSDYWVFLLLLFPLLSVVHGLVVNALIFSSLRLFEVVVQSFINFKFFLYFVIFYSIWLMVGRGRGVFFFAFLLCILVSLLGYILNVFYPEYFLFSESVWHLERDRISGFQFKPNDLAVLVSFCIVFVILSVRNFFGKYLLAFLLTALVFMTSSRTALLVSFISVFLILIAERRYVILFFLSGVGGVLTLLLFDKLTNSFFMTETVSNFAQFSVVEHTQYIRVIMVYYGVKLGVMFFPLGAGAGNFGGVMSADSPAYYLLGISDMHFFQGLSGIYDSNIAAIVGEYGFFVVGWILFFTYKVVRAMLGGGVSSAIFLMLFFMLSLTQPMYSYHVNSVNILLLLFSLAYVGERRCLTVREMGRS